MASLYDNILLNSKAPFAVSDLFSLLADNHTAPHMGSFGRFLEQGVAPLFQSNL